MINPTEKKKELIQPKIISKIEEKRYNDKMNEEVNRRGLVTKTIWNKKRKK